jgi:signal transduction histidine kinase
VSAAGVNERYSRVGLTAVTVIWAAVLVRLLTLTTGLGLRLAYVLGLAVFLAIHMFVTMRRPRSTPALYAVFAVQAALVIVLLAINPDHDFITVLLVLECYQVAIVFVGRTRLIWATVLIALIGLSLVSGLGLVHGLALALVPMAGGIVLSTFVVVNRELEADRAASELMVADLEAARRQLQEYADQVDELAAIEERSRLARELQESVSRTLGRALDAGAAAREALGDPRAAAPHLERLQALAQEALAQMRRIIAELRPPAAAGADAAGTGTSDAAPADATGAPPAGATPAGAATASAD